MAKDDLVHHPRPPQPLPLLLLGVHGSTRVVVDQALSTVGAQESLTGSVNQGGIMTKYESSPHDIEFNITWSTNGEGESFAGTLMSPTIT